VLLCSRYSNSILVDGGDELCYAVSYLACMFVEIF